MNITSSAFGNNWRMPSKYTCDAEGISPPLTFSEIPANAKSLALIMNDLNAPAGIFVHWILVNIDPKETEIKENSIPQSATQGKTSAGLIGYIGVCPPDGTHRYCFKLFALDTVLNLKNPDMAELEAAMKGHIIEQAELDGLYSRA